MDGLLAEATGFAAAYSQVAFPELYGVDNGKTVGTHLEQTFIRQLLATYGFPPGNAAKGIDLPHLDVDFKTTSLKQPQSSCPFRSARQKVYGLGYSLLVFVYRKADDPVAKTARLTVAHAVFVERTYTADYQTTTGLLKLPANHANKDDLPAFFAERMLPLDEIGASDLADEVLRTPPLVGYLTISNALQWRLQYSRVIEQAGTVPGLRRFV
nr:restriction endonuclease [Brasilonema bromeliae]